MSQLPENAESKNKPLPVTFVELTEDFVLTVKDGLFKILEKFGCPPKLPVITRLPKSAYDETKAIFNTMVELLTALQFKVVQSKGVSLH